MSQDEALSIFNRGKNFLNEGHLSDAIVCFEKAIQLEPKAFRFRHKLGEALSRNEKLDEAIAAYEAAIELNPRAAWSYHNIGQVWATQNKIDRAISYYRKAIEISSNLDLFYQSLGAVLNRKGNQTEAAQCYRDAAELLGQQEKTDGAIACYVKAIDIQPEVISAQKLYSLSHYAPLNPSQIERIALSYQKVIEAHPDFLYGYIMLGDMWARQGKVSEASRSYQKAIARKVEIAKPDFVREHGRSGGVREPNFIIIGAMKCGTTSLYEYLAQHPNILPCLEKEVHFFSYKYDRGLDWYRSYFYPVPEGRKYLNGEASPSYIHMRDTERRVFENFPDVKLIAILRNPIDRAFSHYHHLKNRVGVESRSFEDAVDAEMQILQNMEDFPWEWDKHWSTQKGYLYLGLYVYFLQRWMSVFPKEQFLVLTTENLQAKPALTMKQTFKFLGVSDYKLDRYPKHLAGSYSPISDSLRKTLHNFYQPYNQKLEDYLEMSFKWTE
ncbi:MAG: tetratricopeptide repeat protein [Cyanobacteriota bacterium]|nr:tetratricopeptide repeat protein [Cyanobacteriota bacterium]